MAAAGIPFLVSVAMALPTMRRIVGDDRAFNYFERVLRESREGHNHLKKSLPVSTSEFANKYVEGAVRKSGEKIRVNDLQSK